MKVQDELEEILQGCRENNPHAQAQLYRKLFQFSMQTAIRYSRDGDDAANIVTLSFLKIFRSIHSFYPNRGSLYGWSKRIIINEALDFIKERQKFGNYELPEDAAISIADNELTEQLTASELLELIRMLPPSTQTVFNLYVMEGYSHKEIAGLVRISEGTSKWHLSYARKILQSEILSLSSK